MSYFGFNIAGQALLAFQAAEDVTTSNISNVQTPGASRQQANLVQQAPIAGSPSYPANSGGVGTRGEGVLLSSITRVHQDSYDTLYRGATASQNYYGVQQNQLDATQTSLGEPAAGINTAYVALQTSLQQLSSNPSGVAERSQLLQAANALTTQLNNASLNLGNQKAQVIQQGVSTVTQVNSYIDQIAALNGQIRASKAVGDNPNTYLDQRDNLIDKLSGLMDTQTELQPNGSVLVTVDGKALVNDTIGYHIATPVVGTAANGQAQLKVGFQNDPNQANPTAITISSGTLGAVLDLYNTKLTSYGQSLDNFASGVGNETNRITQGSYSADGAAGQALFQPVIPGAAITAGTIRVGIPQPSQIPASVATTAAGTLVRSMNAPTLTVDTAALLTNNTTFANAPAAQITGALTVSDDGLAQTFNYNTAAASTLTAAAAAGANTLNVVNGAAYTVGQTIMVGVGTASQENATVAAVVGNVVTLGAALANNHAIGQTAGGNAGSIDAFVTSFNGAHLGVSASFDASNQRIVFARDPANIDLIHRAAMQAAGTATTAAFTVSDNQAPDAGHAVGSTVQPALGVPATSMLASLGANQINGIQQDSTNAFGASNAGGAVSLMTLFTQPLGAPQIQTRESGGTGVTAAMVAAGTATITVPSAGGIHVGDVLTLDAQVGGAVPQENVTVSAVNYNTNTITFVPLQQHVAGFTISAAQTQTLQAYYSTFVAGLGLDVQTTTNANTSQTALANNIDKVRQGVDGINIDEETQNLIKYQNAYAAAAQTVNVLNQMLKTAIDLVR